MTSSAVASAISLADSIDELRLLILKRYSQLEDHDKAEIISTSPRNWMRSDALRILREASSFRAAERRFRMAVLPLSELGDAEFARAVLDVVRSNYEVYDAGEVPSLLSSFAQAMPREQMEETRWVEFLSWIREEASISYDALADALEGFGFKISSATGESDEDWGEEVPF